jgi:hypothetical protein
LSEVRFRALLAVGLTLGCGRSDLLDDVLAPTDEDGSAGATADATTDDDVTADDDGGLFGDADLRDRRSPPPPDARGECTCASENGGCCQGTQCIPLGAQGAGACGTNDAVCRACGPLQACLKGACGNLQPGCDPSSCAGCCIGGFCFDGLGDDRCGFGGGECENCAGASTTCAPRAAGGGVCVGSPGCDERTCFNGCCLGNVCLSGDVPQACGTRGKACVTCAPGQACVDNGQLGCQYPPLCTVQNCRTCCAGNQCMPGDTDKACGEGSEMCSDCTVSGEVCSSHQCVSGCSATTCAGCCTGKLCAVGDQDFACGSGGEPCTDCTAGHWRCFNHACLP